MRELAIAFFMLCVGFFVFKHLGFEFSTASYWYGMMAGGFVS